MGQRWSNFIGRMLVQGIEAELGIMQGNFPKSSIVISSLFPRF